jgi:hypothetical protein
MRLGGFYGSRNEAAGVALGAVGGVYKDQIDCSFTFCNVKQVRAMNTGTIVSAAIDELLTPTAKLKDALLKVQVLADLMENEELQAWVDAEMNGYYGEGMVPEYRRVGASPRANLVSTYGGGWQGNQVIPVEYMGKDIFETLTHRYMPQGVATLEAMLGKTDSVQIAIPRMIWEDFNEKMYSSSDWRIHSAWQLVAVNQIEGVLATIRSKLLKLLISLKNKFGNDIPLQSLQQKQAVNDNVNQALHSLQVTNGTVNILGANATQSNATASDNATVGVAQGTNITQTLSSAQSQSLTELVTRLKQELLSDPVFEPQREELTSELARIDEQLQRPEPKKTILQRSFSALHDLVKDSIGSTASHVVVELLKQAPILLAAGEHLARHT